MNELEKAVAEGCFSEEDCARRTDEIMSPDWALLNADESHWGFFIPTEVESIWTDLPPVARLSLYLVAKQAADRINAAASRCLDG